MTMNIQQPHISPSNSGDTPPWAELVKSFFSKGHHLFSTLDMEPSKIAADEVCIFATIPTFFSYESIGDCAHPGAYTIILDTVFGFAVFAKIQKPKAIATINLKTDYLRPIEIGSKVICSAECFSINGNVARTRGEIVDYDGRPLASATGSFMIGSGGPDFNRVAERPHS
ncbi:PaaI family thioesterase [Marinicaulis aureus]|uniref:PaaI family thioesterase n=1 Tax=Hyphococcus aureus TaxID=2666033 RepID=A0ABW1KWK3_9PROT